MHVWDSACDAESGSVSARVWLVGWVVRERERERDMYRYIDIYTHFCVLVTCPCGWGVEEVGGGVYVYVTFFFFSFFLLFFLFIRGSRDRHLKFPFWMNKILCCNIIRCSQTERKIMDNLDVYAVHTKRDMWASSKVMQTNVECNQHD